MKAVIYTKYGPPEVLQHVEIEKPQIKKNEILIKIHATSVHRGDTRMRSLNIPLNPIQKLFARLYLGVFSPRRKILGMEIAGDVETIGTDVTNVKVGDRVFASTFWSGFGGYAQYIAMPDDGLIMQIPENISYEEAAVFPSGAFIAYQILQNANLSKGTSILIYGASGSVGSYALQLAKDRQSHVTAVTSSKNLEIMTELGADKVIDYNSQEFRNLDEQFDVVFDAVDKMAKDKALSVLVENGIYLNVHNDSDNNNHEDRIKGLKQLTELLAQERIKPLIDKTYTLDEIVDAHRYVDSGRKRGNVAVVITHDS